MIASSVISCLQQLFVYPWIVGKMPILYLCLIGIFIETIGYIGISAFDVEIGSIISSLVLWVGFCFASPTSVSILSVCELSIVLVFRLRPLKKSKELSCLGITFVVSSH